MTIWSVICLVKNRTNKLKRIRCIKSDVWSASYNKAKPSKSKRFKKSFQCSIKLCLSTNHSANIFEIFSLNPMFHEIHGKLYWHERKFLKNRKSVEIFNFTFIEYLEIHINSFTMEIPIIWKPVHWLAEQINGQVSIW